MEKDGERGEKRERERCGEDMVWRKIKP